MFIHVIEELKIKKDPKPSGQKENYNLKLKPLTHGGAGLRMV